MKKLIKYPLLSLAALGAFNVAYSADVQPPKKREQTVEQATQLAKTATPESVLPPENLRNPFTAAPVAEVPTVRPTSDKDLLLILAEQLQPMGVLGREDNLMLRLKGQKAVKVNEKLTLSFDGATYEVEVTAIDPTSFSLRYNQTEITRPTNKTGKNP